MGRTLPTFNTFLLEEQASWRPFRRALRREQRDAFDRLFTRVRAHVAEATCMARPVPFEALIMAILLEHEMEVEEMKKRLAAGGQVEEPEPIGQEEIPGLAFLLPEGAVREPGRGGFHPPQSASG